MSEYMFDRIIERRGGDSIKWNQYDQDVLPMWVADSDFMSPEPLVRAVAERVRHGLFGYAGPANAVLGKATAHWLKTRFNYTISPDETVFAPSVCTSLAAAVTTFTAPGDNILMLTPTYPPFYAIPKDNGRNALPCSLRGENGHFQIDFAEFEAKAALPRTRLFLLCNPHNPTGKVFTREELTKLGEICLKYDLPVFSDEIHCDYIYSTYPHIPFGALSEQLARQCLIALNPSKTFNIAEMQVSTVISKNPRLLARIGTTITNQRLRPSALGVIAYESAYMKCADYADAVTSYIRKNMEYAVPFINEGIPGIHAYLPDATYLLWLDCRGLHLEQKALADFFLHKAKVALNSGTDFGREGTGFMRMNLACPLATVKEGLARIERAVAGKAFSESFVSGKADAETGEESAGESFAKKATRVPFADHTATLAEPEAPASKGESEKAAPATSAAKLQGPPPSREDFPSWARSAQETRLTGSRLPPVPDGRSQPQAAPEAAGQEQNSGATRLFLVDSEYDLPCKEHPSFVWCMPVSGPEEIITDWRSEIENMGETCPALPPETVARILAVLKDKGFARLTYYAQGIPGK